MTSTPTQPLAQPTLRIAIVGASGYTGAELLRLCAQHPELRARATRPATPRPARWPAALYPSLSAAYPDLVFEEFDPTAYGRARRRVPRPAARGEHGARAAAGRAGRLRRRPVGGVPAEGRVAVSRRGTGSSTTSPSCSPRRCSACPSCTATELKGARLVATPGLPRDRGGAGARARWSPRASDRADGHRRQQHHRHQRRRPGAEARLDVLLGRRGRPGVRPARPPAHARDRAGDHGAGRPAVPGAVHAAPRAAQPRHPRHVLRRRPTGRVSTRTSLLAALRDAVPRRAVRGRAAATRRRPRRRWARTRRSSPRATTSGPNTIIAICAIDNLCKGASGGAVQAANVALGLDETAGLQQVGLYP